MTKPQIDRETLELAKTYAMEYIEEIDNRPVYPNQTTLDKLSIFDEPLPIEGTKGKEIIQQLHHYGSPATVATIGGRYFGFVNGGVNPTAIAARWLGDAWDQNAAMFVTSPISAKLEMVVERWLVSLFGLPEGSVMGLLGGTSTATMVGLITARNTLLERKNWDVNNDGLFGAPEIRIVLSEGAHSSVNKALALIGLGKNRVEKVPTDSQGRILEDQIPELDEKTLLILQAGNVNTGAFDNFSKICKEANNAGAWVHIDGAFGLWAAASPQKKHLTNGIELADSWSVDGHKTLNTPYDCGIVFCRDGEKLKSAMEAGGAYLKTSKTRDGMLYVPQMSRRARSIDLWATLKALGGEGIAELINELCKHATNLSQKLREEGFNIINDVVFNQVLVTCENDVRTEKLISNLQNSGEIWLAGTNFNNRSAIRVSVCSWTTTEEDIDRTVQAFISARKVI